MTMPADIRSLAQEAVDLAMVCECGHHRDAHEGHTCMVGQDPPRHCSACGCPRFESQSEAASHAGTHYATIAKALLEALDSSRSWDDAHNDACKELDRALADRDEARRRFHARDAEADRLAQRISRAFDEVNAPAMGAEPHERIQMLADDRDHWRTEATRRADDAHAAVMDRLEMERGMLRACADRDKILAALPHALRSCGCEQKLVMRQRPGDRYERPAFEWPEQHEAAIEWLQGRIK